jgi:hypothetical protein
MTVASRSNVATKARKKAEADFATWLMMAKLGGFDELPPNAQSFLNKYRARLESMTEAESTNLAVREVYAAYYSEMGGEGAAPEPQARKPTPDGDVVQLQKRSRPQSRRTVARHSISPTTRKTLRALLIFAGMVGADRPLSISGPLIDHRPKSFGGLETAFCGFGVLPLLDGIPVTKCSSCFE